MDVKLTKIINKHHLSSTNQTRINLKRMKSGYRTPKVDSWTLAKMWGVVIKIDKYTILATTNNDDRDVTIPLNERLITRKAMLQWRLFRGQIYMDTIIYGVKYASGNKVDQMYVADFGDFRIYPFTHLLVLLLYGCKFHWKPTII